jgi:hypothetical protein
MGLPRAVRRLSQRAGRARRRLLAWLANQAVEHWYGVRTRDRVYLEDLGLPSEERVWHAPSDWLAVRRAIERLELRSDDVFVDYGSGLGRVVLVAASLPLRRVIGVEVSAELTARARRNLAAARGRVRARTVDLVTADARDWEVPADLTAAYLYSPFLAATFDAVLQRLLDSVDDHPRPLRILYNFPLEHSRLLRTGRVRVLDAVPASWRGRSRTTASTIVTYLVLPTDARLRTEYARRFPQRLSGAEAWLGEYEPGYMLQKPARLGGVVLRRPRVRANAPTTRAR